MKHLLFFLFLIPVMSFGQTANYTSLSSTDLEVYSVSDKTLVYEFYDTLSGSNDTLIISFPKEFAVDYTATLGSTWVSTGTTTDSDVFLQGRNASHETWTDLGTTTFAAETTTAYSDGIDVGGYLYYRLVCVSASGNAHLKNTLVLKKKVGSSASAGGGASYLVYTALLTQSGTSAPVATVLENTLGGTVVWSRDVAGIYVATLSGAFTANKTTPISQREQQSADNVDDIPKWLTGLRLTDNTYGLNTGNYDLGLSDSVLNGAFIEIRVYP